jgi:hypothetical protein
MEITMISLTLEPYAEYSYIKHAKKILSGDPVERPSSLMNKESCELLVETGSDTLLICVGESWTWGESIGNGHYPDGRQRHLASGLPGHADPVMRIEDIWPGKMARMMHCDLHTHAVPGNSNSFHFKALKRILSEIPRGKYRQVKYVICLTDPARDFNGDFEEGDPRFPLFVDANQHYEVGEKITMDQWLTTYDEAYLTVINQLQEDNADLNIEGCVWKNFNDFQTTNRDYLCKVIELPYIRWAAKMCGMEDIALPKIQAAQWWENHCNYKILEQPSIDYINAELDKLENQYRFIIAVPTMISELNRTHPNYIGMWLWAWYMADKMDWITFPQLP